MPRPGGQENPLPSKLREGVPVLSSFHTELRERGFNPPLDVYIEVYQSFLAGLRKAVKGEQSDISFIRNPLPDHPIVTDGIVQGFVYGGTNYRSDVVILRDGNVVERLKRIHRKPSPTDNVIDMMTEDFDLSAKAIGANIGQELIPSSGPFGELDGTPTERSQGVKGQSIERAPIGDTMRRRLGREFPVAVANDTVAIAKNDGGVIIGSGLNKAIIVYENGELFAVNLESGGQQLPESQKTLIAKVDSQLPENERNKHEIEKITAGKYLPIIFNLASQELGLSTQVTKGEDLTRLAATDEGNEGELARVLFAGAALREAAQLAGVYEFLDRGAITLIGDGSLIRDGWSFQSLIQQGLLYFGVPEGGVTIITPQDVAMKGAIGLITGSIT